MYGVQVIIFLMSAGVRFRECWDSSRLLSSIFVMFWNPALIGGVKNGLNVSIENSSGVLVNMHFVMLVAMPVCMTMSRRLCQRLMSRAAVAPFFVLTSCNRRSDGSVGVVMPSGELAKRIACWKSLPIFFQAFLRSVVPPSSSSDSSGALLNLFKLFVRQSSASSGGVWLNGSGLKGVGFGCRSRVCRSSAHDIESVSEAGAGAVDIENVPNFVGLQKAQSVCRMCS